MFENILNDNEKRSSKTNIIIVTVALLLIALPVAGYFFLHESKYEALFSDLGERDAAAIVKELGDKKIDYKLNHDGSKIMVEEGSAHDVRLQLMSEGAVLSGESGFEIFDNTEIGMTEFAQRINYQRALQGELSRTISSFSEIKHARVHLVIPQTSLFKKAGQKPKASVSLILKRNAALSFKQISGIQRLVAAAVPELGQEGVTIVNQSGEVLSRNIYDKDTEISRTHISLKKEIEDYLTRKVVSVLDHTFGAGKAIVSIDVSLHMESTNSKVEQVIPVNEKTKEGILVKKHEVINHENTGPSEAVFPYDDSLQTNPPVNKNIEVEYEVGRKIEQIISAPGGIKRISIGVLVPAETNSEQIEKVHDIVTMSVGINKERGDAIAVHSIDMFMQQQKSVENILDDDGYATDFGMKMSSSVSEAAFSNSSEETSGNKDNSGEVFVNDAFNINYALFLISFFIVLFSIYFVIKSKNNNSYNSTAPLSREDRELILSQVKDWMKE